MDLTKNTKELEKIVKFCRKNGITSLKSGDFALELSPSALFPESPYLKNKSKTEDVKETEPLPSYTEEEALFWSSAGVPPESEGAH